MICPSCQYSNSEDVRYCGRCRLAFTSITRFLVHLRDHFYWILRRANAGFMAGLVAWFFIPALSRVLSSEASPLLHFMLTGLLGGAFLGTVDGMMEESTPKTVRGTLMGCLGGAIGGTLFVSLKFHESSNPFWGLFLFWAVAGAFIGVVSALWERKPNKLAAGIFFGAIGGGMGGALGYALYGALIQTFDPGHWFLRRLYEGFSGGVIGITLWFSIALAERFFIFKRRSIDDKNHKHCDHCQHKNALSAWYCVVCGSVLQVAAIPENLNLPSYITLDRLRQMFRFLSRLSATIGFIASPVIFFVFLPVNPFFACISLVLVAVVSYSLLLFFSSLAEALLVFVRR